MHHHDHDHHDRHHDHHGHGSCGCQERGEHRFAGKHHLYGHGRHGRFWELMPTREEQIAILEDVRARLQDDLEDVEKRLADLKGEHAAN